MIVEFIGNRVKELRLLKGLSQEKLAMKACLDRTYIAGIEKGKRNVSSRNLEKLLNALEISFHDFFEGA